MNETVEVNDVSPRDGLQNEPVPVSTEQKLKLIDKLVRAGVSSIQATSFMRPDKVPQMADAEQVGKGLGAYHGVHFSALIPNLKGYDRALKAGFRHVDFVMSASDTFNRRNVNQTIAQSLDVLADVSRVAVKDGVSVRVGFASSFHCPFEGRIPVSAVVAVVRAAKERGAERFSISDTDGMAFPDQVKEAVSAVQEQAGVSAAEVILHFHDTYGRGLANTLAGLQSGVRSFDSCVGGLGGCPFCPGASGNLATEDLVAFLDGLGYSTGIQMEELLDAAEFAKSLSSRPYQGHLLRAHRPAALAVA